MARTRLCFVGVLPRPVTGMTLATEAVLEKVAGEVDTDVFAIRRPTGIGNGLWVLYKHCAFQLGVFFLAWCRLRGTRSSYIVAESGKGLVSTLVLTSAARLFGMRILMHHHVFSYVNETNRLMQAVVTVAGARAQHIFLCDLMMQKFTERYACPGASIVLSNAYLVEAPDPSQPAPTDDARDNPSPLADKLRLGFLGNITRSKGIDLCVDAFEQLAGEHRELELHVAGPVAEPGLEELLSRAKDNYPDRFDYLGPVYGDDKRAFFEGIDLLVFPTRYRNEAQPLTIFEAAAHGVPTVAFGIGCIEQQVEGIGWSVNDKDGLESIIRDCLTNPQNLADRRKRTRARFDDAQQTSSEQLGDIVRQLQGSA